MRWSWRFIIAVVVGVAIKIGLDLVLARCLGPGVFAAQSLHVGRLMFGAAVPAAIYALLTWRLAPRPRDSETHCRRCDYILRGLVEPRCPECGERI